MYREKKKYLCRISIQDNKLIMTLYLLKRILLISLLQVIKYVYHEKTSFNLRIKTITMKVKLLMQPKKRERLSIVGRCSLIRVFIFTIFHSTFK